MNEGQNSTLFRDLQEDVGQDETDWDADLEAEEVATVGEASVVINKEDESVFLVPATPKKRTPAGPRADSPVPFVPRKSRRLASLGPLETDDILSTSRGNNRVSAGSNRATPTASPTRKGRTPKTPRPPRTPRAPKTPAKPRKKWIKFWVFEINLAKKSCKK